MRSSRNVARAQQRLGRNKKNIARVVLISCGGMLCKTVGTYANGSRLLVLPPSLRMCTVSGFERNG